MSFNAEVLSVLIASPSDVIEQRDEVETAIYKWNNHFARDLEIVLLPTRWETDTSPAYAYGNPQGAINNQIVMKSDIVIGIFGHRFGSPTLNADSGTIEEINIFIEAKKPVMVYFVDKPPIKGMDYEQAALVDNFKKQYAGQGIYFTYKNGYEIKDHLYKTVREYKHEKLMAASLLNSSNTPSINEVHKSKNPINTSDNTYLLTGKPLEKKKLPKNTQESLTLYSSDMEEFVQTDHGSLYISSTEKTALANFDSWIDDYNFHFSILDSTSINIKAIKNLYDIGFFNADPEENSENIYESSYDFSLKELRMPKDYTFLLKYKQNAFVLVRVDSIDNKNKQIILEYRVFVK